MVPFDEDDRNDASRRDDRLERTVEPASYEGEVTADRPLGVTVVALLYGVMALGALAGGAFAVWSALTASGVDAATRGYGFLVALLALVAGGITAAVARGLWERYRSAWALAIFVSGLAIFFGVVGVLFGNVVTSFAFVVVNAVVVWYLLTSPVRDWFAAPGKARTLQSSAD